MAAAARKPDQGVRFIVGRPLGASTTALQSVVFSGYRWTRKRALGWLEAHGLKSAFLAQRGDTLRARQGRVAQFQPGSFRTVTPGRIERPITLAGPRENPKRGARRVAVPKRELEAAVDLFQKFREKPPQRIRTARFRVPKVCVVVGELDFVGYTTTHAQKRVRYQHNFAARARPLLCASADGRQVLIFGGNYDFTRDGIVDRA